jgi:hypothetical protein
MTAEHRGRDGVDALMAAITDEPLPDEVREDAAFLAEHRSAAADVAALREQLGIIGRALGAEQTKQTEQAPEPVHVRPSRVRRRAFTVAFGTAAVAAVAAVVTGMGWLFSQSGQSALSSDADAGSSNKDASTAEGGITFGGARYLACARLVGEGTATAVEPLPGGAEFRVTLDMTRYYKPEKPEQGEKELTFVVEENIVPGLREGDHVLIGVPKGGSAPDYWLVGDDDIALERDWIIRNLPESRTLGLTCE